MYVIVNRELVSKSADFAKRVCASYIQGRKENSRRLVLNGKPEIYDNPHVQMIGRIGEIAGCVAFGLDPDNALNWSDECDSGHDFMLRKWSVDIKASDHPRARRLIWPASKEHFMAQAADILILALVKLEDGVADVDVAGYETKNDFIKKCRHAKGERGIVDGTPYMDKSDLKPVEDIIAYLAVKV